MERVAQSRRETARELRGVGGGRHRSHGVEQQAHVEIVLRLVSREDPLESVQAARALDLRALLPHSDARTLAALGRAQRLVGAPDQPLGVDAKGVLRRRDASTELQAEEPLVIVLLAQPTDDVLRHEPPVLRSGVAEHDGEDGPPIAGHVILAAQGPSQAGGDLAQDAVARAAVESVVHPGEVVRAEEKENHGLSGAQAVGQRSFELRQELPPLGKPGDLVEHPARHRAGVHRDGCAQAEKRLPPLLVGERVWRPRNAHGTRLRQGILPVEAQADPSLGLSAAAPTLASLTPGLLVVWHQPMQRDTVERASAIRARDDGPPGPVSWRRSRPVLELSRRLGVGELGDRRQRAHVDQDLPLASLGGPDVEGDRTSAGEPAQETGVGPQDVDGVAHVRGSGKPRTRVRAAPASAGDEPTERVAGTDRPAGVLEWRTLAVSPGSTASALLARPRSTSSAFGPTMIGSSAPDGKLRPPPGDRPLSQVLPRRGEAASAARRPPSSGDASFFPSMLEEPWPLARNPEASTRWSLGTAEGGANLSSSARALLLQQAKVQRGREIFRPRAPARRTWR